MFLMTLIKGKVRLWIEYGLIGLIVVMSGFVVTLWIQKQGMLATMAEMGSQITAINLVNQAQESTIGQLLDLREKDALAIQGLLEHEDLSERANTILQDKLNRLEQQNEDVRRFLDIPIPPELCALARYCNPYRNKNGSDKGSATGNTGGTLQ